MDTSRQYEETDEIDLLELFNLLKKYIKPLLLSTAGIMLTVGIITYFFLPKTYKSYTTFYIQEKSSSGMLSALSSQLGALGGLMPGMGGGTNSELCSEIILARSFLERVLKDEGLPAEPEDVRKFKDKVSVELKKSQAIEVSAVWKDPETAYKLTRRIFDNYQDFVDEQINMSNSSQRRFLNEQFAKGEARLNRAEQALVDYQKEHGVILLPEETQKAIEYFAELEKERVELEIGLNDAERRLAKAENLLGNESGGLKNEVKTAVNPVIQQYKLQLTAIELELAKARENYTDNHPAVKNLLRQRDELTAKIESEKAIVYSPEVAGEYLKSLIEVTGLEARKSSVEKVYGRMRDRLAGLPTNLLAYGRLVREQKVAEQIYIMLAAQLEQSKIAEAKEDNVELQVIDPPVVPDKKAGPSTVINMLITAMAVFFGGCFYIVLKEQMLSHKS